MLAGAIDGNSVELLESLLASLSSATGCSIFVLKLLENGVRVWHWLQVFRQSKFSASAVRSVTHCAGVKTRTFEGNALPVRSGFGSRRTPTSLWLPATDSGNNLTH